MQLVEASVETDIGRDPSEAQISPRSSFIRSVLTHRYTEYCAVRCGDSGGLEKHHTRRLRSVMGGSRKPRATAGGMLSWTYLNPSYERQSPYLPKLARLHMLSKVNF